MTPPLDRREFLKTAGATAAALALGVSAAGQAAPEAPGSASGGAEAAAGELLIGFTTPPMDRVRMGFVGVGGRGTGLLRNFLGTGHVDVKAVCDIRRERAARAQKIVQKAGQPEPEAYTNGDHAFEQLCKREDIDLVINATPWEWHVPITVFGLQQGRHVGCEVPLAMTVDDCWEVIHTAERARRHCLMMENCCYGDSEMMVLNMVRQGVLGELIHAEAGYIHNLLEEKFDLNREGAWRTAWSKKLNGNTYPTHGLGPVAQYMNINRGDRFEYLTSMSSPPRGLQAYATQHFGADDPRAADVYVNGDMNTSILKTHRGLTVMLQHDTSSPRPYSRINTVYGTQGVFADYPPRLAFGEEWLDDAKFSEYHEKYQHPLWKKVGEQARKSGGHGGMDYVMAWRLIDCLRRGEPLDQTIYDGATWSCIVELSCKSVANKSAPVDFPDFTRGAWKSSEPLGVVS